ncbi:hypothetical protein HDV05_004623 [Chytridiales sp. JEL 0842]|nr:hypothetical protein HDV05_004623 [Chytridiales sp. JEL 0842]
MRIVHVRAMWIYTLGKSLGNKVQESRLNVLMDDASVTRPTASKDDEPELPVYGASEEQFDVHHSLHNFYKDFKIHPVFATFVDRDLEMEFMIHANSRSIRRRRRSMTIVAVLYALFIAYQIAFPFLEGIYGIMLLGTLLFGFSIVVACACTFAYVERCKENREFTFTTRRAHVISSAVLCLEAIIIASITDLLYYESVGIDKFNAIINPLWCCVICACHMIANGGLTFLCSWIFILAELAVLLGPAQLSFRAIVTPICTYMSSRSFLHRRIYVIERHIAGTTALKTSGMSPEEMTGADIIDVYQSEFQKRQKKPVEFLVPMHFARTVKTGTCYYCFE